MRISVRIWVSEFVSVTNLGFSVGFYSIYDASLVPLYLAERSIVETGRREFENGERRFPPPPSLDCWASSSATLFSLGGATPSHAGLAGVTSTKSQFSVGKQLYLASLDCSFFLCSVREQINRTPFLSILRLSGYYNYTSAHPFPVSITA